MTNSNKPLQRAYKEKPIERASRFYNYLLDSAKPYERASLLGIFVVEQTMDEIIKATGATAASILGGRTGFNSWTELVEDFSESKLELHMGSRNSDSLIFDLPTLEILNLSIAHKGAVKPELIIPTDLSRYKLATD